MADKNQGIDNTDEQTRKRDQRDNRQNSPAGSKDMDESNKQQQRDFDKNSKQNQSGSHESGKV